MNITLAELQDERQRLTKDFNELKDKIQKVEIDVGTMKSNLNAFKWCNTIFYQLNQYGN